MELALTIIAGLGALLFVVSYFGYVVSGFKHHFVTGIISALPVLNIVTLPSLWDKSRGKFIVGILGLSIVIVAWFMGANKGIHNLLLQRKQSTTENIVISADPGQNVPSKISPTTPQAHNKPAQAKQNNSRLLNEKNMLGLPNKPLYTMSFDIVPVDNISSLKGRIVQITNTNNEEIEGRIKNVTQSSVVVDGLFENELPIASIKQLRLMVKKTNQ